MPTSKLKASERQAIIQKLSTSLRKIYGKKVPTIDAPVLETMLIAACLEDTTFDEAQAAFERLISQFHDLNEIRVSSITEIERALGDIEQADFRALRIRDTLQTAFETYFAFDLDVLKKKTHEQAGKELANYRRASTFMKQFVMQQCLGGHVMPVDQSLHRLLVYLGLAAPDSTLDSASEDLKSAVRKSDAAAICYLLRCVATDPQYRDQLVLTDEELEEGIDPTTAPKRLEELLSGARKRKLGRKKVARSGKVSKTVKKPERVSTPARKKAPAKKTAVKKKVSTKKAARKK